LRRFARTVVSESTRDMAHYTTPVKRFTYIYITYSRYIERCRANGREGSGAAEAPLALA
jgi:hypothetical protein